MIGPMASSHNVRTKRKEQARGQEPFQLLSFERVTDVAMGVALVATGLWVGILTGQISR